MESENTVVQAFEAWDDVEQTPNQEKPKLCKIADPDCEACQ